VPVSSQAQLEAVVGVPYYETPAGGAVFATSSIAWSGSLSHNGYDNNVSRITGNVLERFIQERR
jgi:N,N-dimethylformamidase